MFPEFFSILVAAGNGTVRQSLLHCLAAAGYRLEEVSDEQEAFAVVRRRRFDLVLLGFDVTGARGSEACRELRIRAPHLRVVMVREDHHPEAEELALDAGADDCIAAPFRFRELVARLSAVLRRVPLKRGPKNGILRAGCLEVDSGRGLLRRAGREVQLSPGEFDTLLLFMKNPEMTFTHLKLLRALRGSEIGNGAESLRNHINGLRKKIEDNPATPEYILTEPWVGYRFHNPGRDPVHRSILSVR